MGQAPSAAQEEVTRSQTRVGVYWWVPAPWGRHHLPPNPHRAQAAAGGHPRAPMAVLGSPKHPQLSPSGSHTPVQLRGARGRAPLHALEHYGQRGGHCHLMEALALVAISNRVPPEAPGQRRPRREVGQSPHTPGAPQQLHVEEGEGRWLQGALRAPILGLGWCLWLHGRRVRPEHCARTGHQLHAGKQGQAGGRRVPCQPASPILLTGTGWHCSPGLPGGL